MLKMLVADHCIVEQVLNGDLTLEEKHICFQPEKIQIIPNFDVNLLQPFCDDDAFSGILSVLKFK